MMMMTMQSFSPSINFDYIAKTVFSTAGKDKTRERLLLHIRQVNQLLVGTLVGKLHNLRCASQAKSPSCTLSPFPFHCKKKKKKKKRERERNTNLDILPRVVTLPSNLLEKDTDKKVILLYLFLLCSSSPVVNL